MKCSEVQSALPAYLDQDLPAARMSGLEEHLRSCAACERQRELLVRSWDLLEAWEPVEPSYQLKARIWEQIRVAPPPSGWDRLRAWRTGFVLATTMCLCLLVGLHVPGQPGSQTVAVATPATEDDELAVHWSVGEVEAFPEVQLSGAESEPAEEELPMGSLSQDWMDGAHEALGDVKEDN